MHAGLAVLALAAIVATGGQASAQSGPPAGLIKWRVENPFRLFTDPAITEMHRAAYADLTPEQRPTPVLSTERMLALNHPDGWAAGAVDKTCWSDARNRYECGDRGSYLHPKSHAVLARIEAPVVTENATCVWSTAPRGGRRLRGVVVRQPCSEQVRLEVPYPAGADVTVEIDGLRVARTHVEVRDLLIVGLGDSFGSGEGNPDVPVRFSRERTVDYGDPAKDLELSGYPARVGSWRKVGDKDFIKENARWLDQACHRSLYSHQARAALQLALEDPHRAVTFAGFACSGAEVTAGLFLRYKGNEWVPNPPDLSQISAAAAAQCATRRTRALELPEAYHMGGRIKDLQGGLVLDKCDAQDARKIDLLFVSIGGNDIGFARLVANAILADASMLKSLGGWFGQVHGRPEAALQIDELKARYRALKRVFHNILHIPWDESDRVILAAYPGMAILEDGQSVCPDGRAGLDVVPGFLLSQAKAREGGEIADELNAIMRDAAVQHGWTFAERHRPEFFGRGICAGQLASGAIDPADDLRLPRFDGEAWQPYNPAEYRPYASRTRWFRTPNDAFMTGNFHVAGSVIQQVLRNPNFSWFQVLLAATYSGAFHPTAEGHAAIADAVAERARAVLEKYDGANHAK